MNYRCFKRDCELEASYFRKCLFSEIYCCESHLKILNRTLAFDTIFVEPLQKTKNTILDFLTKKKLKIEKARNRILNKNPDKSKEFTEETIKNLNCDLEEISLWIEKISQTQKIAKKEQDSLLNLLILQPDIALKQLKAMISSNSKQDNSASQLYWLNELKAKTSYIWNNLNIIDFEQDFRKTCELYENQRFPSDPLLNQAYQEYIKAFHQTKSIYHGVYEKNSKLFIYDTEEEKKYIKDVKTLDSSCWIGVTPFFPAQLPNGELFFTRRTEKINNQIFIINRNYEYRELPSLSDNYKCYPLIYYKKSVYCYGLLDNSCVLLQFNLDENIWIYLCFMPSKQIWNSVIFNGNILIAADKNIILYSIDINSFSIISYEYEENINEEESSSFQEDSDDSWEYELLKQTFLIKAEEKLYFIKHFSENSLLIYESENEYTWKQIAKAKFDYFNLASCLYNKRNIYFSFIVEYNFKLRQYCKFDLDQGTFTENSYYFDFITLKQAGKMLEKIEIFCPTFKFDSDSAAAYILKGKNLKDLGYTLNIIEVYNREIRRRANYDSYNQKGWALMDLCLYPEAMECFNEASRFNNHYGLSWKQRDSYLFKGDSFRRWGRSVEALECYDKAYNIDNDIYALIKKGNTLLYDFGRSLEAIKCYDSVINLDSRDRDRYKCAAYYHKGNALLYDLGWNLEAIECYNNAIYYWPKREHCFKEYGNLENIYNNKGYALNMLGRSQEAVECYNKVIEINPKDAMVYNNKGDALNALGRNNEAIKCHNKAIELKPDDFLLLCNRGRVLNSLEYEEDALKDFYTAYNLLQKTFEESLTSDSIKKKVMEWNSNFLNDDLSKGYIELLKKLLELQECVINFKREFINLKNAALDIPQQINKIEMQTKAIKTRASQIIARIIEFLGSNNHETIEEVQQQLSKLQKEAFENEKLMVANISDFNFLLNSR